MPLTEFQSVLARLLASNRSPDSHLADGAALHLSPNSQRYSNDLDYFHDSVERVATAFADDRALLEKHGYSIDVKMNQPAYIRAQISKEGEATKVEWAHDSAWRFLPVIKCEQTGYRLHPIDLATNKVLALVGRNEPRDLLDTLMVHAEVLPLGALCWAAVGKDPGFTPLSLLEMLRRRSVFRPEDFARLHLNTPIDLPKLKTTWRTALDEAEIFMNSRPADELGCLYYHRIEKRFVQAKKESDENISPHFGRPGGVMPQLLSK